MITALVLLGTAVVGTIPIETARGQESSARRACDLLPMTTKAFVSLPDIKKLQRGFVRSQIGQFFNDPQMQPLVKDIVAQSDAGFGWLSELGLRWSDLQEVYAGEVAVAIIQPDGDSKQHARAILMDFSGKVGALKEMQSVASKRLIADGATSDSVKLGGVEVSHFTVPRQRSKGEFRNVYFASRDNWFLCTDHLATTNIILGDIASGKVQPLSDSPAFVACMKHSAAAHRHYAQHLRWFAEPFGLLEVVRAACGGLETRGVDYAKVLRNQGFDVIQGVGGVVGLVTDGHEALQHTFVYAPGAASGRNKFTLAARMLEFPNSAPQVPASFVPSNIASYVGVNWHIKDAFHYMESLVNEIAADDIFADMLNDIANDPNGPRLDIRNDVVAHFSEHVTVMFSHNRNMMVIKLKNPEPVAKAFYKSMSTDEFAKKHVVHGHVVWELLDDSENLGEGDDFNFGDEAEEEIQDGNPLLQFNAVTVAHNHLIMATHFDAIENVLNQTAAGKTLAKTDDYQMVNGALTKLEDGKESLRFFVRTSDTLRSAYEVLRESKLTEVQLGLGTLQIRGSQLPTFDVLDRYGGPAGFYLRTEKDGWLLSGCLLSNKKSPGVVTSGHAK
jgi:hypothetical protein